MSRVMVMPEVGVQVAVVPLTMIVSNGFYTDG